MDNATITAIVTCVVTGLLSAGGWKFYEAVLKSRSEKRKEENLARILKSDVAAMKVELGFVKRENEYLKLKLESRL